MKILLFVFALCAFMYMAPSDGMDVIRYYGKKGTICKQGNHWIVKINCKNTCRITKPKAAFKKGGRVHIQGRQGQVFRQKRKSCGVNCFCTKRSKQRWNHVFCMNHKGKKIKKSSVYFDIWCVKKTTNLRFRAQIRNLKHKPQCPTGETKHDDGVCRKCNSGKYDAGAVGCKDCLCGTEGSKFQSCATTSGDCKCKAGYKDRDCKNCEDQYYKKSGEKECLACECNNVGTKDGGKCSTNPGVCDCKSDYSGDKCDGCTGASKTKHEDGVCRLCNSGKYDDGTGTSTCLDCNCGVKGSKFQTCAESTGDCDCKDGYKDRDCKTCADKFYKKVDECLACECDKDGAGDSFKCADNTGECTCNPNFKLPKCKECKDQFYFKTSSKTCEACACDPDGAKNLKCAKGTGNCECKAEAKGTKCVDCSAADHYRPAGGGACRACNCNTVNTVGNLDTCDRTGQCTCGSGSGLKCA